jgi:hypothetical protein
MYPLITPVCGDLPWRYPDGRLIRHLRVAAKPALREKQIHLWVAKPVLSVSSLHDLQQVLSPAEQVRMQHIRSERYRSLFVETHAALRHVLGLYTGAAPRELRFGIDADLRPLLIWPVHQPPIYFGVVCSEYLTIVVLQLTPDLEMKISNEADLDPAGSSHLTFCVGKNQMLTITSPEPAVEAHLFALDTLAMRAGADDHKEWSALRFTRDAEESAGPNALPSAPSARALRHGEGEVCGESDVVERVLGPDPVVGYTTGQVVQNRGVLRRSSG